MLSEFSLQTTKLRLLLIFSLIITINRTHLRMDIVSAGLHRLPALFLGKHHAHFSHPALSMVRILRRVLAYYFDRQWEASSEILSYYDDLQI